MKAALFDALSSQCLPANLLSLCKQEKLDPQGLQDLIEFILQQDHDARSDLEKTQQTLARALLAEPYAFDSALIQALAHRLPDEQLIPLIFELLPAHSANTTEAQRTVHHTVEELITVLVIRSTRPNEYQRLISGKPQLANLLMKKRLQTLADPTSQQALIFELLDNYQRYDWQEESFLSLVHSTLLPVFLQLPEKKFKDFFKRFYSKHAEAHAEKSTQLISELTERIPEASSWMQSCLLQDKSLLQQPKLITFFLQIKQLHPGFLDNVLKTINNLDLLNLLLLLIELNEKQQVLAGILDNVLDCFCLRLFYASGQDNDPIHQWQTNDKAPLIALYLASKPSCLQSLSNFSTIVQNYTPTVLQGLKNYLTKNGPDTDLKNRSVAVIASLDCNNEQFKEIALATLCHFRQTPQIVQTLFANLESANTNLKKRKPTNHQRFEDNYQHLKEAFWELIIHEQPYDEKAATQLLTTQLNIANCFDWLLITLMNTQKDTNSPVYLSQIDSKSLIYLKPALLATVLLQSNTKETTGNWQKIDEFLKRSRFEDQLTFVKALMQPLISQKSLTPNRPLADQKLVEQAFQLITKLQRVSDLIVELDFAELQWLITNSPAPYLKEQFPNWLDSLLNSQKFDTANGCELLTLLPAENLEGLLAHEKLIPYFPNLFLQFAKKEAYATHQVALFKRVSLLDDSEKQTFIASVHQLLFGQLETPQPPRCLQQQLTVQEPLIRTEDPPDLGRRETEGSYLEAQSALFVLTTLLMSIKTLPIHDLKAKELIRNQLRLINQIAHHAKFLQAQSPELQQLVFNLLSYLNAQDSLWIDEILNDAQFAALVPLWLKSIDATTQNQHPFTHLVLDHTSSKLHPNLLANPDYQQYLKTLLSNRPSTMTDDRFKLLFTQQLAPENQHSLAKELLHESIIRQQSDLSRITLASALSVNELYALAVDKEGLLSAVFVELLIKHPDGLNQLSEAERSNLLSNLKHRKQLLPILDGEISSAYKISIVEHIFDYLLLKKIDLSDWLEKRCVDGQTLAALANYTTNPAHQELIKHALRKTTGLTSLQGDLKDYLLHPTLTSPILPKGFLYWLIKDTFLHPQTGWRCDPSLLSVIKDTEAVQEFTVPIQQFIMRNQFLFLAEVHQLHDFYAPFDKCNNSREAPLNAARWLRQLPLLSEGLLQIVQDFLKMESVLIALTNDAPSQVNRIKQADLLKKIDAIKKTGLYVQLIQPILFSELSEDTPSDNTSLLTIQFNNVYDLLDEYRAAIEPHDSKYSDYLYHVMQKFKIKQLAIKHASFPGAHDLFYPPSPTEKANLRASLHSLDEQSQLLNNAVTAHSEKMATMLSPSNYLISLINILIKDPTWLKGSHEFTTWLFACLTSPLTDAMSSTDLAPLLTHYPIHTLIELLNENKKKLDYFQSNFEKFAELKAETNLQDMLNLLLSMDLLPLLKVCEFAELPHLTNLIHFALQITKSGLPPSQLIARLLPSQLTKNFELQWLKFEIAKLDETKERLVQRHNTLISAAFNYNKSDKSAKLRLTQLPQLTKITSDSKTLMACLKSYLPIFKTDDPALVDEFMNTIIQLLYLAKPDAFIAELPPALLERIMNTALQSPEKYKSLIIKLMEASVIDRHIVQIRTQLTALIGTYKPKPPLENLTFCDLSPLEMTQIDPVDFKRILFLQHLLLQISPPSDLAKWVNDCPSTERKIVAHFAADAGLYEQIITLFEQTVATDLDEKGINNYQINRQNGYRFIAHDNHAYIYGELVAKRFNQPTTPSDSHSTVLYHYLNIASIVSNDNDILEQERLNLYTLLRRANLKLDNLIKLHRNCPSKALYPIYGAHILSYPDFFTTLHGKLMLDELKPNSYQRITKCERLRFVVQSIDLPLVPDDALQSLEPEAAATLFCSVPHFPQLNETNIPILLNRVGAKQNLLIRYWIHAYAQMPNYDGALFKLTGLYPDAVTRAISEMPLAQRQKIVSALLIQLEQQEAPKQTTKENQLTALSDIINNYLHDCEADSCPEQERQERQTITHQLICGKINLDNQQVLINQFWKSLKQSNGRTIAYSLQQDTKKFIRALSVQRTPEQLVELFDKALPHLNGLAQEKTMNVVKKARAEAQFEDSLSKLSFLKTFRSWWRRCIFYGFFSDKQPKYLASANPPKQKNTTVATPSSLEKLTELLSTMKSDPTDTVVKSLFDALAAYEQEPKNKDEELAIRIKIEQLFAKELSKSPSSTWLLPHMHALITNRNQLIALYCAGNQQEALQSLLLTAKQGPGNFSDIYDEFVGSQESPFVEAAIELVQDITDYATSIPPYLAKIPEGVNAITGQLRKRIPALFRTMPEQLRELPGRLWAMPKDVVNYVGGHFNFFSASTPTVPNPTAERSNSEHIVPEPSPLITVILTTSNAYGTNSTALGAPK